MISCSHWGMFPDTSLGRFYEGLKDFYRWDAKLQCEDPDLRRHYEVMLGKPKGSCRGVYYGVPIFQKLNFGPHLP